MMPVAPGLPLVKHTKMLTTVALTEVRSLGTSTSHFQKPEKCPCHMVPGFTVGPGRVQVQFILYPRTGGSAQSCDGINDRKVWQEGWEKLNCLHILRRELGPYGEQMKPAGS